MDVFTAMRPLSAAALYIGLLIFMLMMLKGWVGRQRYKYGALSGDTSNSDFNRASRVQANAVEDVPALMVGIVVLALLGMPTWYIHMVGIVLVVSRILHATGLAAAGGKGKGRLFGTLGTMLVFIAVGGALVVHAFTPTLH